MGQRRDQSCGLESQLQALASWDQTENTFQDYKWPLMPFIDIPYNIEKWILSFSSLSSVVWFSTQENNTYIVKKSKRTKNNAKNIILFCKSFRPIRPIMRKKSSVKKNHEIIWTISITVKGPKDLQNIYPLTCYWSLFLRSNKFGDQNAN